MDLIRYPYKRKCRFFSDSDEVGEIRWYPAKDDAPVLGYPSGIMNVMLESDKDWIQDPLGEIWEGAIAPTPAKLPPGIDGDHVCGTEDDFLHGCEYDTDLPDVQYGAFGFPLCCNPPVKLFGFGGGGGRCMVSVPRRTRLYGFAGGGGRCRIIHDIYVQGGWTVGGQIAGQVVVTEPTQGGWTVGGQVEPQGVRVESLQGGWTVGGEVDAQVVIPQPASGGWTIGSDQPSGGKYISPTLGGFTVGGKAEPQGVRVAPLAGGWTIGGEVNAPVAGTLSTTNLTGGPLSLDDNLVLHGGQAIQMSVSGLTITVDYVGTGPVPPAPTAPSATPGDSNAVLTWTPTSGTQTRIYRSTTSGGGPWTPTNLVTTQASGVSTYTDTGLTNGTTYYYVVTALTSGGAESVVSSQVTAVPVGDLLLDNFSGTNGTAIGVHLMDIGPGGIPNVTGWVDNSTGTVEIESASMQATVSIGAAFGSCVVDSETTGNLTVTATVFHGSTSHDPGLLIRWSSDSNYYAGLWNLNTQAIQINQNVSGVVTTVATGTATGGDGQVCSLSISGSTITFTVGSASINFTGTLLLSSNTKVGCRFYDINDKFKAFKTTQP